VIGWALWALLLLLQNGSATWVSRARNSRSLAYHALASIGSNGIWLLSLGFAVDKVSGAWRAESWGLLAATAAFYTVFTVAGSVGAHHLLMTRIERGDRKVG
jgi:O-antigen/teichoic acid export membrane protein